MFRRTGWALGVARPAGLLIPPPRRRRHRYHGLLAPNAPLRAGVTARPDLPVESLVHDTPQPAATEAQDEPDAQPCPRAGSLWAMLLLARTMKASPRDGPAGRAEDASLPAPLHRLWQADADHRPSSPRWAPFNASSNISASHNATPYRLGPRPSSLGGGLRSTQRHQRCPERPPARV